jgi:hypothetical protein
MKKRIPFNEAVLRRLKERRERRNRLFWSCGMLLLVLLQSASLAYFNYWLRHRQPYPNAITFAGAPQMQIVSLTEEGIPSQLNINGETWRVIRVRDFKAADSAAQTSCQIKVIFYLPTEPPSLLRNSIIHEIFHAGACLHGGDTWWNSINPDREKHDGVYHLADFWTAFARSNPEFMEWISR